MKLLPLIFCSIFLFATNTQAGVRSIINTSNSSGGSSDSGGSLYTAPEPVEYKVDTNSCPQSGYTHKGCPSGYRPIGECPYNSSYYIGCCPAEYQYQPQDCTSAGLLTSEDNCFGYYACISPEEEQTQPQ